MEVYGQRRRKKEIEERNVERIEKKLKNCVFPCRHMRIHMLFRLFDFVEEGSKEFYPVEQRIIHTVMIFRRPLRFQIVRVRSEADI